MPAALDREGTTHKWQDAAKNPHGKPLGWLRDARRTSWQSEDYSDVDLSKFGLTDEPALIEVVKPDDENLVVNPGETPERLLRVPGFINRLIDRCLAGSPAPLLQTAFCGALALQAHLAGRRVREPGDLRTNLYLLALTGSSAGKNYPRRR